MINDFSLPSDLSDLQAIVNLSKGLYFIGDNNCNFYILDGLKRKLT